MVKSTASKVYVVGAGLSVGLGFPTIKSLLPKLWPRLEAAGLANDLADVIRFHHPSFHPAREDSYPDIEQLLSEMQANAQLFDSSRPATGNFTKDDLEERRRALLLEIAAWFHDLKADCFKAPPVWLRRLVAQMNSERAKIVSFNWDLVLDEMLFGSDLDRGSYGFDLRLKGPMLIKPHGSLNWYEQASGHRLKESKKFQLVGTGTRKVFAFRPYRAPKPKSPDRQYMPLIVPPVFGKQFDGPLFKRLWQNTVSILSTASEVVFLGYSLPDADFHARFILRCGFFNQEHGELLAGATSRTPATGRSKVIIVDPSAQSSERVRSAVGWNCEVHNVTAQTWVEGGAPPI